MERLLKQTLHTLAKLVQSDRVALLRITQQKTGLLLAGLVETQFTLPRKSITLKETPIEQFLMTDKTSHVESFPCTLLNGYPFPVYDNFNIPLQCLCIPLYAANKDLLGVFMVAREGDSENQFYNLHIIERLQALLAVTFETALENNNLSKRVTVDSFTGLHSHHYFEKRLQEEFVRCERHGGAMSVLMIEIDHFQAIATKFGYQHSRRALQLVSKVVSGAIRQEIDIPCRYGSSQIILLLPNTDVDGAMVVAERIRERCEQNRCRLPNQKSLKITVSIGVSHNIEEIHDPESAQQAETAMNSEMPYTELSREELNEIIEENEISKEDLLYRAEVMLTAAQQAGHNQVMIWW